MHKIFHNQQVFLTLTLAILSLGSLFLRDAYSINLAIWMALAALCAASLRFVTLIGELNFAIAAFYGIGAYGAGAALTVYNIPFLPALLLGGVIAALVSLAFGYVTLKTKGPYFLLIGFAFTEVMRILYARSDWLGGNSGMVGIFPPTGFGSYFPLFAIGLCSVLILALYLIERSSFGKVLIAIRDNDNVVLSVGINVHLSKVVCFGIASFVAGIGGSLHGFTNNVISPGDFGFLLSTFTLAYLKVGGENSPFGPLLGSIVLLALGSVAMGMGAGEHIFYGAAIVISVLLFPNGLVGIFSWGYKKLFLDSQRESGPAQDPRPAKKPLHKKEQVNG